MRNEPDPPETSIRVLVADSSSIHTHLLASALKREANLEVIPFDSDYRELPAFVTAQKIDVLIISSDLQDEPSRGLEALRELRAKTCIARSVVLVNLPRREVVLEAFRAGAKGVFRKSEPIGLLGKCIRCVYKGQIWANSSELTLAVEALAAAPAVHAVNADGMSLLSKRELQVVRCLAEGLTNREIAERLKLSQHTVKNYLFRVFDKLGVSSRVELLFMTLAQSIAKPSAAPEMPLNLAGASSSEEFVLCQRAAEAGLPAAQLTLAQVYLTRKSCPEDLVHAYMWYLIATERASQAKGVIAKVMTSAQIDEARRSASAWLSRLERASRTPLPGQTSPQLSIPAHGLNFKSLD
jgi:two-component system, NarL family, nitrate/nitrite response regulator NarL